MSNHRADVTQEVDEDEVDCGPQVQFLSNFSQGHPRTNGFLWASQSSKRSSTWKGVPFWKGFTPEKFQLISPTIQLEMRLMQWLRALPRLQQRPPPSCGSLVGPCLYPKVV